MVILVLIVAIAAIEIILAALVFKTLWGASEANDPRTSKTQARPHVSSAAAPLASPGGTSTRSPGRAGARYVDGCA